MEQTCRHLMKSRRDVQTDDGIEALSRAAVQLPAYVERIRDGGRDVPLVLLPLLNDLRAARGRPLLSESTLLLLNIAPGAVGAAARGSRPRVPAPARPVAAGEPPEDAAALAKVLRPRFQLALLGLDPRRGRRRFAGPPAGCGEPARGRIGQRGRAPAVVGDRWRARGAGRPGPRGRASR